MHASVPNYQYYPAPNYRSYFKQDLTRGLLRASMEELVARTQQSLELEEERLRGAEVVVREHQERRRGWEGQVREEDQKLKKIREQIRKVNGKITNLRNEDENEAPVDIAALEDDLQTKNEELENNKGVIEEEKAKFDEVVVELKQAKKIYDEIQKENEAKMEAVNPLREKLDGLEVDIKKARKDGDHYKVKLDEYKTKVVECEGVAGERRTVMEGAVERAKVWAEEKVETRKKVRSFFRINDMMTYHAILLRLISI